MRYVLSCCSTADLSKEHFQARDIHYICFHYEMNGVQYADDLGVSMPFDQFYKAMEEGADTKTSQVNVDEFVAYFTGFLEQGLDILHVCLSTGISGVYNSANAAKELLEAQYPERKILVLDSLGASSGYGLLMDKLADLRDAGLSLEELYHWAETPSSPAASLVLLHGSYVLCKGRTDLQGQRLVWHQAENLPAAEYG